MIKDIELKRRMASLAGNTDAVRVLNVESRGAGEVVYPTDHQPGIRVPKGGSMCKNCEYLKDAENRVCGQPDFIKWNGSEIIPLPVDEYCSDWYKPAEGAL